MDKCGETEELQSTGMYAKCKNKCGGHLLRLVVYDMIEYLSTRTS